MGEGKKIVVDGFPVEKLPDELRRGIESGEVVRVTVESCVAEFSTTRPLSEFFGCAKDLYASQGVDPADYIRKLRDEWE
jgi:hypothetical protein